MEDHWPTAGSAMSTDGHKDYVYYAMNIGPGTNTVTVSITSTATIRIAIHEYSGIATSAALDVTSGGQGTGTTVSSGNATTTDVRELVFGVGSSTNADTWAAGSGFTLRQTPANKLATEDQVITTTQTLAASFSISPSDNWAAIVVTFRAASAGTTDIGFSYTSRGEPSDVYESTPHSGGYYHVAEQFWANGAAKQVTGLASLPTFTFNVDGEGRTYQVSASSGQNPVTNTAFNNASQPTSVTFGSTDTDSYTYDPNTNRMTQYQFSVNGSSLTGTLTWNANSTLHGLNITDALNSADNQSCSFLYDDLARLASTDCGTVWSQTYSYDAFGNIKKSGNAAFQPTYDAATNHITSVSGFNPTYDNNGNTLTDPSHTYSWDSAGKPVGIDSVNMTYDALGRMVEQNRSGTYTQFVYGPHGRKFAIFSGQTLQKAFIPLPGGAQAVYNASGILYYGHSDHLGSTRLGSTTSRTVSFDVAYAPFGETYAASGSSDPSFTGQRQDTVSGLYDFPAREYNSQGRWSSPDPLGLGSLNPLDPQTLNRYVYARNTPTSMVDPFGMESCDESSDPEACGNVFGGGGGGSFGVLLGDGSGNLSYQVPSDDPNYSITVTANLSDTQPLVQTESAPTGTLLAQECGGCFLSQIQNDPVSISIINGASTTVNAIGWTGIGIAGTMLTGGALEALAGPGSLALDLGGEGSGVIVNLGGEGEVAGAINVQGPWALDSSWASSASGQSLSELQAAGNQFVIANNTALPFADGSVSTVITNSVPINTTTWLGEGVQTSEIARILQTGGTWINNGIQMIP